ncbi:MAG: hypothetical protein Q7W56_08365 [Candidatus Latescibacteria bacterium]|nr:hypothetical protein [Candidatus Latescibacterota bacterium]
MIIQRTLMTCHKGVDLHAATAERVMRRRLEGGEGLAGLARAEFHTFWQVGDESAPESVERLLTVGRYFNPNKHHFAHFVWRGAGTPWTGIPARGDPLPGDWPGEVVATDLPVGGGAVLDRLLGGAIPAGANSAGASVVDVCAFPLGEASAVLSGVLWRLALAPGTAAPADVAGRLVETRSAREGLLVNPHMQGWLASPARSLNA